MAAAGAEKPISLKTSRLLKPKNTWENPVVGQ